MVSDGEPEKKGVLRRVGSGMAEFARGVNEVAQHKETGINTPGRQFGRIAGKTGRALKNVAANMERELVKPQPTKARVREEDEPEKRRRKKRRAEAEIHIHFDGDDSDVQVEDEEKEQPKSKSWADEEAKRIWG
jgi:hypothetical protein